MLHTQHRTIVAITLTASLLIGCGQVNKSNPPAGPIGGGYPSTPVTTPSKAANDISASSSELKQVNDTLKQLQNSVASLSSVNAQSGSGTQSAMQALFSALGLMPNLMAQFGSSHPALAASLRRWTERVIVFQYMDPTTGARAYAAPRSEGQALFAIQSMAQNGFTRLEAPAYTVLRSPKAGCSTALYEWVYSNPNSGGHLYAYLTKLPNGERSDNSASWGHLGFICETDPGDGAVPLYRLSVNNGEVAGNPYVGVTTVNTEIAKRLVSQGWRVDARLGWAYRL